jgi:hypothetical protein
MLSAKMKNTKELKLEISRLKEMANKEQEFSLF